MQKLCSSLPPHTRYTSTFPCQLPREMSKTVSLQSNKLPAPNASERRKEHTEVSDAEPLNLRKCSLRFSLALATLLSASLA